MSFVREHRDRFGVEPVLRVLLLSAYACLPERGSEPGIGCMVLLMAARHHDMWLRTQPHMAEELEAFLADHPVGARVHLEAVGAPYPYGEQGGLRRLAQINWHHDQWQRNAAASSRELDRHSMRVSVMLGMA